MKGIKIFSNSKFLFVIKISIAAGLLYALISFIDFQTILSAFQTADYKFFTVGIALSVIVFYMQFLRWRFLLSLISVNVPKREIVTSILIGMAAGFATPAQLGEVAGRLASHQELRKSHVAGIFILDKIYISIFTILLGIFGLTFFTERFLPNFWHSVYIYFSLILFFIILFIAIRPNIIKPLQKIFPAFIREHRFFSVVDIINSSFHSFQALILSLLTVLWYGMIIAQYYFFIHAFSSISFFDTAVGVGSVFFIKNIVLPISIGDIGIRETAAVYFFGKFGIAPAVAFNSAILTYIVNTIIPGIFGALLILKLKMKIQ